MLLLVVCIRKVRCRFVVRTICPIGRCLLRVPDSILNLDYISLKRLLSLATLIVVDDLWPYQLKHSCGIRTAPVAITIEVEMARCHIFLLPLFYISIRYLMRLCATQREQVIFLEALLISWILSIDAASGV